MTDRLNNEHQHPLIIVVVVILLGGGASISGARAASAGPGRERRTCFDRQHFLRADHNGDGVISRIEFLREDAQDDDREDRIGDLDLNNDGRLSRAEWHGSTDLFHTMDRNRDGFLSRAELLGDQPPTGLFESDRTPAHDGAERRVAYRSPI